MPQKPARCRRRLVRREAAGGVAAPAAKTGAEPAAGAFSSWWARSLLNAILDLAGRSLPSVDALLDLDAGTIIDPRFVEYPLEWTKEVNKFAKTSTATCVRTAWTRGSSAM